MDGLTDGRMDTRQHRRRLSYIPLTSLGGNKRVMQFLFYLFGKKDSCQNADIFSEQIKIKYYQTILRDGCSKCSVQTHKKKERTF